MQYELTPLHAATLTPISVDGSEDLEAIPRIVDHLERDGRLGDLHLRKHGRGDLSHERRAPGGGRSLRGGGQGKAADRRAGRAITRWPKPGRWPLMPRRSAPMPSRRRRRPTSSRTRSRCSSPAWPRSLSGAPETPFYYYHIPALTGAALDMVEFLPAADAKIGNMVGHEVHNPGSLTCTKRA